MMRRFIVMHNSEPGWSSTDAAKDWIYRQERPSDYRVVEIKVDPVTERICDIQKECELDAAFARGAEMERRLMRLRFGLGVPGDSQ